MLPVSGYQEPVAAMASAFRFSTFNFQPSTFNLQPSALSLPLSTFIFI
jgi:hypothetical protein